MNVSPLATACVSASAGIAIVLGIAHLRLTFFTHAFAPRDRELAERLKTVSPVLSNEMTMWRSQIGLHASHSIGLILFGAVYGYLAIAHPAFFYASHFLLALGAFVLVAYLLLAKLYWFSLPLAGVGIALGCYLAGAALALF